MENVGRRSTLFHERSQAEVSNTTEKQVNWPKAHFIPNIFMKQSSTGEYNLLYNNHWFCGEISAGN